MAAIERRESDGRAADSSEVIVGSRAAVAGDIVVEAQVSVDGYASLVKVVSYHTQAREV